MWHERKISSCKLSIVVRLVCCSDFCKLYFMDLLIQLKQLCRLQPSPVGSASGLLGGNQVWPKPPVKMKKWILCQPYE